MNIRKPADYSTMYAGLERLLENDLPQMEQNLEIGKLLSARPEKGAAVAAAEYLAANYPERMGFSPRNLRRMRDFYRTYESNADALKAALLIGWTQNVVILEAELTMEQRCWYIQAVCQFGWSKAELLRQIKAQMPEKSIWAFSGYLFDRDILSGRLGDTREYLRYLDVLVDGPFVEAKKNLSLRFRGSENQRLIDVPKSLASGQVVLWEDWQTQKKGMDEDGKNQS